MNDSASGIVPPPLAAILTQFLNGVRDGVIVSEASSRRILYANGGAHRLYGYAEGELIGLPITQLRHASAAEIESLLANIERQLAAAGEWIGDLPGRKRDGSTFVSHLELRLIHVGQVAYWVCQHRDVSAEVTRQRQTLKLAERLRLVADTVRDIFWLSSPDRRELHYVSPAVRELLGRDAEEFYANPRGFLDSVHPDDREMVAAEIERHGRLHFQAEYSQEYRILRRDGDTRWLWTRYFPIFDEEGTLTHLAGVSSDITERKMANLALEEMQRKLVEMVTEQSGHLTEANSRLQAELARAEELQESLRVQAEILEQTHDAIIATDLDGRVTAWNKAAERDTGYSRDEALGRSIDFLYAGENRGEFRSQILQSLNQFGHLETEARFLRKDGSAYDVHLLLATLRDRHGAPLGSIGSSLDITERKRAQAERRDSERRLRDILDSMFTFVGLLSTDGTVLEVNRAPLDLTGLARDEIVGKKLWDIPMIASAPELPARLRDTIRRVAAGKVVRIDLQLQVPAGSATIDTTFSPLRDADGRITQIVGSGVDISERLRIQEEVRQRQEELTHILRVASLSELATGLAHEINQPLMAIATYAEALKRLGGLGAPRSEPAIDLIQRIAAQSQRAGDIVRKLRELARKSPVRPSSAEVDELVNLVLPIVLPEARLAGIRIEHVPNPGLPLVVADRIQIQQVLMNLVLNAIEALRYFPANPLRRIMIRSELIDGEMVRIAVVDNGPGIPPETSERIFQPFYSGKAKGLGMGLPICRSILSVHGGALSYEATPGGGATFLISLPVS